MIVTFVSQCEKKSLNKTRRVLDAFANRIGSRTWQTPITTEGLLAVKTLLRKTATKNTAVACHRVKTRRRVELEWIVGNRDKFNFEGHVPVNYTEMNKFIGEVDSGVCEIIAILSKLAGFFHDIGKANLLFQRKLDKNYKGKQFEPYRHEWVSVILFIKFVNNKRDKEWLKDLVNIDNETEKQLMSKLNETNVFNENPFSKLDSIAKIVAWLIVSHHRLPQYPTKKEYTNSPTYNHIDSWLDVNCDSFWNSTNINTNNWSKQDLLDNWQFKNGTLFKSALWQTQVSELAQYISHSDNVFKKDWINQRYVMHVSRLCLMISDHYYSGREPITKYQDRNYLCWANTKDNGEKKQKLDEHNICVGLNAYKFSIELKSLKTQLNTIKINKKFTTSTYKNSDEEKTYGWQEASYQKAKKMKKDTKKHGFFGINMASTGRGKTVANARIMAALSDKNNCRFSVALGLRTLTLQTGKALAEMLDLKPEEYGVIIGSQAVKDLYIASNKQKHKTNSGSESERELAKDQNIIYGGTSNNKILKKWLKKSPKLQQLIEAPLLVSTIDHLIPATEGIRGGRQIAPMLRLLTSDLILDEPDDFGLEDLSALCRLVNWAGMLGSKVLLSTATMPPSLSKALFESYQNGWRHFSEVNNKDGIVDKVYCAWFDEFNTKDKKIDSNKIFAKQHNDFIKERIICLNNDTTILRKATFLPMACNPAQVINYVAETISTEVHKLHNNHKQKHENGKSISIGLVRMANINPLVAVAKELFKIPAEQDYCIHYCVYHSRYPLALRSHIENRLDNILDRRKEDGIWQQAEIEKALCQKEKHHIFIVLATSVAEVGRDHDYDWAIAEPSSMRSIIQLAGRIQRHRKQQPKFNNLIIFTHNIKALEGKEVAYEKPGFEVKPKYGLQRILKDKDISKMLDKKYITRIDSIPRIKFEGKLKDCEDRKKGFYTDFVELEHWAIHQRLLGADGEKEKASYWWKNEPTWCAEIQKNQPFRKSYLEENYALRLKNNVLAWCLQEVDKKKYIYQEIANIEMIDEIDLAKGNRFWLEMDEKEIYSSITNETSLQRKSEKYGQLRLRINKNKVIYWQYNKFLGVFNETK